MVGQTLQDGRYKVLRHLGSGRMGDLFAVWDKVRGGELALKSLAGTSESKLTVILKEFPLVSKVSHLSLAFYFDIFEEGGSWWMTTELFEGGDWFLKDLSKDDFPGFGKIANLFGELAKGVGYLHQRGACHGELAPEDVVIDKDGDLRIYNYGFRFDSNIEDAVAPEEGIVRDWIAIGQLLYLALTGTRVDSGLGDELLSPKKINTSVPEDLSALCERLLSVKLGSVPSLDEVTAILSPELDLRDPIEDSYKESINHAENAESRIKHVIELIQLYYSKEQYEEAYELAREEVAQLGVDLPQKYSRIGNWLTSVSCKIRLLGAKPSRVVNFPSMQESKILLAVKVIDAVLDTVQRLDFKLYFYLVAKVVGLFLRHGNAPGECSRFYALYWFVCRSEEMDQVIRFQEARDAVLQLASKSSSTIQHARAHYLIGTYGALFEQSSSDATTHFIEAQEYAAKVNDSELTGHILVGQLINQWLNGVSLDDLWEETEHKLPLLMKPAQHEFHLVVRLIRHVILNLKGKTPEATNLESDDFDEGQFLGDVLSLQNRYLMQFCYLFLASFYTIRGRTTPARIHAHRSSETMAASQGMWIYAEHYFIELVANACDSTWSEEKKLISNALRLYQQWAELNSAKFEARKQILFAEDYLMNGRKEDALSAFLSASQVAQSANQLFLSALSLHRAASIGVNDDVRELAQEAWTKYGVSERLLPNIN